MLTPSICLMEVEVPRLAASAQPGQFLIVRAREEGERIPLTICDYDASKAGVISLTHNMAKFYAPDIRVNCVCPGWMDTDMNKDLPKDYIEDETAKIYIGRFAQPKEIAKTIYFLASDESSYINSEILTIDGGYY